jgi:TPR repeat protein
LRAGTYPPIDDGRYGSPYLGDHHVAFGNPHRKSAAVWRGIALVTTLVALAVLVIMYQHDVGTSLIWLGETLTGKAKASAVAPEKQRPASTPPSTPSDSSIDSPAANSEVEKNAAAQVPDDASLPPKKDLDTARGNPPTDIAPAGIAPAAGSATSDRPVSVLERQGPAQKAEPVWNEGDSVDSLWGAVQSGSVSAEVSLAERFARGEGVNKNCDQAKVLMKAAADRGNREARLRLYEMETGGCR